MKCTTKTEYFKHWIEFDPWLSPHQSRVVIKNLYDLWGMGGTDNKHCGLEYGFDIQEYVKFFPFDVFYGTEYLWYYQPHRNKIWIKHQYNAVLAKLLLGE